MQLLHFILLLDHGSTLYLITGYAGVYRARDGRFFG